MGGVQKPKSRQKRNADASVGGDAAEKRRDPGDSESVSSYTQQEFIQWYGQRIGLQRWRMAGKSKKESHSNASKKNSEIHKLTKGKQKLVDKKSQGVKQINV